MRSTVNFTAYCQLFSTMTEFGVFQVCSNGTRVYIHRSIWDSFVAKLVARTKRMKIGDPLNDDTTVGATISPEQFDIVLAYIEGAKAEVGLDNQ